MGIKGQPDPAIVPFRIVIFIILLGSLVAVVLASLMTGASGITITRVFSVLLGKGSVDDQAMIHDVRLPRALLAALVGMNLAMAGVLIQTMTRNPLASAQTFGINAGAALGIVTAMMILPSFGAYGGTVPAFIGACLTGSVMWALSLSGQANDMRLALTGITIQLVLSALVQGILIANDSTQDLIFWLVGSVNTAQWAKVMTILPFTLAGGAIAILAARHIAILSLDRATGRSLGQNLQTVAALTCALILVLACPAVAVAGPIGFVGLIVPHAVRYIVGEDQKWLLVFSGISGAILLCTADLIGRLMAYPAELPVGIVTALLGAPAFLLIASRRFVR